MVIIYPEYIEKTFPLAFSNHKLYDMIFSEPKHSLPKDDSIALPLRKPLPYKDPVSVLPAITALNIARVQPHPTHSTL